MIPWWLLFDAGLAIVAILAALILVPSPFRDSLLKAVRINIKKAKETTTTPIEREMALIAGPQKTVEDAQQQVLDLQGSLQHENNVLLLRQDELTQAEGVYYKSVDDRSDAGIVEQNVVLVAEKEEEVNLQQTVVNGLQTAVATAYGAVEEARRELRRLQMTVKSDQARDMARVALENAAKVIEAAQSIGVTGGALARESRAIEQGFQEAKARLEMAQGDPEARNIRQQAQLEEVRRRLDARRGGNAAAGEKS